MENKRLTLQHCKKRLRVQTCFVVMFGILSAITILQNTAAPLWFTGFFLFGLLGQSLYLVTLWKQYMIVKQAGVVYSSIQQNPTQLPQIVSIIVMLVVTVFIAACSALIIYVALTYFNTQLGWTVCGPILLALWLFMGYCWYRIFAEKPRMKPISNQEQPEGVWPPAPKNAQDNEKR